MNRPDLKGITAEQSAYIEFLEGCTSGASNLIKELNLVSNTFAEDLMKIRTGTVKTVSEGEGEETTNLIFLKDKATDKTFERVMVLYDKIDKIKALATLTAVKEADKADKPKRNIQDFVVNK